MVLTKKTVPLQAARARPPTRITALLEDVLGCKWSWSILRAIHAGTVRPGQIKRAIPGLSTKVLNERLRKLVSHSVLEKTGFPKIPPHVEYGFTALGKQFLTVLQKIEAFERERTQHGVQPDGHAAASGRQLRR